MTLTTETGNQNFVVFFDVVETTVTRYESGDPLAIFDQLNSNTFANGRVRLFGFDTNFFEHNALGVRGTGERVAFPA